MFTLFKVLNRFKPQLKEIDPTTLQRVKEGSYLVKIINETDIAARKCEFYAGKCTDDEIKQFFLDEVDILSNAKKTLEEYYESMTKES